MTGYCSAVFLFDPSVHTYLHVAVLTPPCISVSLESPSFPWLVKEGIVKSSEVLYIPYRMHRSVNVALYEFSYKLNGLRRGFVWKVQGILLMPPCVISSLNLCFEPLMVIKQLILMVVWCLILERLIRVIL